MLVEEASRRVPLGGTEVCCEISGEEGEQLGTSTPQSSVHSLPTSLIPCVQHVTFVLSEISSEPSTPTQPWKRQKCNDDKSTSLSPDDKSDGDQKDEEQRTSSKKSTESRVAPSSTSSPTSNRTLARGADKGKFVRQQKLIIQRK